MNYVIGLLIVSITILFFYAKHLYTENNILIENEKLIISGYETSIKNLEDKANFNLEIEKSKAKNIKSKEWVKQEKLKRGEIDKSKLNGDYVIVTF